MSYNISIPVKDSIDINNVVETMEDIYRAKGYNVLLSPIINENMATFTIEKDSDGIKNFLGMGTKEEITLSLMKTKRGSNINIALNDGCQIIRILTLAVGWFLCMIPFITGIIGFINESNLKKGLINDLKMQLSN